jgi:hypothetical protein
MLKIPTIVHRKSRNCWLVGLGLLGFLAGASNAAVNDVLPGDFFPLTAGMSTVAVYAYERRSHDVYAGGRKQLAGELDTRILALRLGHFFTVGGKPLSVVAV